MARRRRFTEGGHVYHVLNRSAKRTRLFDSGEDYFAFERLLAEARERVPVRIISYSSMPNHWHLLLWPRKDGDLTKFVKWLATTHAARWNRYRGALGHGAVYQSRYKSIPVECGTHLLWVWRYIERNALRAKLVERAQDWRWCSLWHRMNPEVELPHFLDPGPITLPMDWCEWVNQPQTETELEAFRRCLATNGAYGSPGWNARWMQAKKRGRPASYEKRKNGV
jgi:putative transposase